MKKLLALLLSVLMMCSMIPFAAVSAAEGITEPTIVISTVEAAEAGDEIEVTVNLMNIPEPGLIGAIVEIGFDPNVFELVTYYDEDEEMWLPQIEVGSKYNASSNKYIAFAAIDEETGKSDRCFVMYLRSTARETQTRYEEHFFTATFRIKEDAPCGTYPLTVEGYNRSNFVLHGNTVTDFAIQNATVTIGGTEPEAPSVEHTYAHEFDIDCNVCGAIRVVVAPVIDVKLSISEDVNGLAFRFEANVTGFAVKAGTFVQADYTNATYNGYKLIETGVIASNGKTTVAIKGERMCDLDENGKALFAYRITNIPNENKGDEITMIPYYIVEIDGVVTTVYGKVQTGAYAEVAIG